VLIHSQDGAVAATVQMAVEHVTPADAKPFPWPARAVERAAAITAPLPAYAAARGLDAGARPAAPSLARADALGLTVIASGAVLPQDCDVFGRMRMEQCLGRVSDGVERLAAPIREAFAEAQIAVGLGDAPARLGVIALEHRLTHRRWPRAGDRVLVRSGFVGAERSTYRLTHWLLDPDGGEAWGTNEAAAAILDLDARKIVPLPPAARQAIDARVIRGLTVKA
jgi:acyl-CoA thioester hydrolase